MESFNGYLPSILIFLGLGMLAIEVGMLGFSIMVLFFIGLGCLATGLLMVVGLVPQSLGGALLGSGLLSLLAAVGLWKPLKRLQDSTERKPVTSDLIGHRFVLDSAVSGKLPGKVRFSGIDWQVVAEQELGAGTEVEVVRTSVGRLTVRAVAPPGG